NVGKTNQQTVAVAIPFARQWEERRTAEETETASAATVEPDSYTILHSDDMAAQVPPAKVPTEKTKAESSSKPSTVAAHKTDSTSKSNPFRNVSLEKEVALAAKSEAAKPVTPTTTPAITKTDKAAPTVQPNKSTEAAKVSEPVKSVTAPQKEAKLPDAQKPSTPETKTPVATTPAPAKADTTITPPGNNNTVSFVSK
ncbi:MAG: hypothetical protein Q4G59_08620, partial [Planctomycetia bacterium]|nr:hypothetical protein [Planctomycetia bacterium]